MGPGEIAISPPHSLRRRTTSADDHPTRGSQLRLEPPPRKTCEPLRAWARRTAEAEFARTIEEPSPDAPPDAQPPPGQLREGLRRAWFCQLQERCRELMSHDRLTDTCKISVIVDV